MFDPMTVAFDIKYPWRSRASPAAREFWPKGYRQPFITVWHKDPCSDGTDSSCWHRPGLPWRWHFWHWRIQVQPLGAFKRWAFTRCAVCGGRFKWNESGLGTWSGDGPRWFRSENLIHMNGVCDALRVPGSLNPQDRPGVPA